MKSICGEASVGHRAAEKGRIAEGKRQAERFALIAYPNRGVIVIISL